MIKNSWLVIKYNLLNESRLINNLKNQGFVYYIPKIFVKKNSQIKSLNLFPGYGFVQYEEKKVHSLKYTKGLKYVLKSGSEYSFLDNGYIQEIRVAQLSSADLPVSLKPKLNSDAIIIEGPLKGRVIKVIGFKSEDRIKYMYDLLGRSFVSDIEIENIQF